MRHLPEIWRLSAMSPWREFASIQRQMDRLLSEFAEGAQEMEIENVDFVPACDFDETDTHYLIAMDVPGMERKQLNVEITGNTLRVSGEKNEEKKEGNGRHRYERYQGRFERSFTLPEIAASEKVEADYKDGVLCISIPKSEKVRQGTRKIEIGEAKNPLFAAPEPKKTGAQQKHPQREGKDEKKAGKSPDKAA